MTLSDAVARLLLLGYCAAVFLLFGSDSFAAVLIGVGAGWYRRTSPGATASSPTRPHVGRAAMNAGKRQACRRLLLVVYGSRGDPAGNVSVECLPLGSHRRFSD
jgi:hypothetical protein